MKHQNIKAIIFDLGGVILDFKAKKTIHAPEAFAVMFNEPVEKMQKLLDEYDIDKPLTGKETSYQFLQNVVKILGSEDDVDELYALWKKLDFKSYECVDWELLEYIKELKKKFKVYVLSDAFDIVQDDETIKELQSIFDGFFVSYKEGLRKPHKEAFLNLLKKTSLSPEECIFVDDTIINVETARKMGINSLVYKQLKTLKRDLNNLLG